MSATPWIVGGVVVVGAGAAAFYFWRKGHPAIPPAPTVKPGIAPGTPNAFSSLCKSAVAGVGVGAAASQGAPPQATSGIANTLAGPACSLLSTVGNFVGKEVAAGAGYVAQGAVAAERFTVGIAKDVGSGVATGASAVANFVWSGSGACEDAACRQIYNDKMTAKNVLDPYAYGLNVPGSKTQVAFLRAMLEYILGHGIPDGDTTPVIRWLQRDLANIGGISMYYDQKVADTNLLNALLGD